MANIMTPSVSQKRLIDRLRREIGHTRKSKGGCPYVGFLCLNSGSESVTVAARITDIHAKNRIDKNSNPERVLKFVSLKGSFHGRTDRPGELSDSSRKSYAALASYRHKDNLLTVIPNDLDDLRRVFAEADKAGWMIEAMFLEPVMGEGNPGQGMTPAFYKLARELTTQCGAMLVVDSIQAGIRAHGTLSVVDYEGFEDCLAPDMETYSKAINGGQYPLSVLAMNEVAAKTYKVGVYGNTMTTNPRAIEIACTVLDAITPDLRRNIRERGKEFVDKLLKLGKELPGTITGAQGTGLLLSCALEPKTFKAYGAGSIEDYMRKSGIGVIHGGEASLRFTPHFSITSDEIDLVIDMLRTALKDGPRRES
jgi:acetylornithine/succinyldiaminopimelate/putrescine aminotransferase